MNFVDVHAHLTDQQFHNRLPQLVDDLKNHNLDMVFTVGYDLESSQACVQLATQYDKVYAIVGIHPSDIETLNSQTLATLSSLLHHPKVLAVGEIGLDYHYGQENKDLQKQGFVAQLELAHNHGLPIVIHTRDASEELLELLNQNKHLLTHGGMVHCFSETYEFYEQIEKLGLSISVGGAITFKNATDLQQTVARIPLSAIMLETDSPYLTPMPYRGKVANEPKFIPIIAQKLAELKQTSLETVAEVTTQNARKLFQKLQGNEHE